MHKDKLIENFRKFPGIGPKQAERFAYFVMKQNKAWVNDFINNINNLRATSMQCNECMRFSTSTNNSNLCDICSNPNRNGRLIMIVEKELDVDSIERGGVYEGIYFVLGGHLPFLASDPKEHINIEALTRKLIARLKDSNLDEIIFALPVNDEGDNEMEYIRKVISQIVGIDKVKISNLARGVSTGLEMEYIDKDTFKFAFESRK
jgi:recombination protein RecR